MSCCALVFKAVQDSVIRANQSRRAKRSAMEHQLGMVRREFGASHATCSFSRTWTEGNAIFHTSHFAFQILDFLLLTIYSTRTQITIRHTIIHRNEHHHHNEQHHHVE